MTASPAKIAAARRNGKKGGAPRKTLNKARIFGHLMSEGLTVRQAARIMGVCEDTCWTWMKEDRRLSEAYKKGRAWAVRRVEDSLHDKAIGMTLPDCHVTQYEGVVTVTPLEKHLAPDTLAQIFYLKNRAPERWADRTGSSQTVTVAGLPEAVSDRIRALARAKASGQLARPVVEVQEVKPSPTFKPTERLWSDY